MKAMVGELLGLGGPIRESAQIPTDQLDRILASYQKALTDKPDSRKEAA